MGPRSSLHAFATVVVVGSACLGLALIAYACAAYQEQALFIERCWPVRARVAALEPVAGDAYHSDPVITFTAHGGTQVRLALPGADLSPGDSVNVLYDEYDPSNVRINDYWALWFETWAFGIAGSLLILIPLLAWLREAVVRPRSEQIEPAQQ